MYLFVLGRDQWVSGVQRIRTIPDFHQKLVDTTNLVTLPSGPFSTPLSTPVFSRVVSFICQNEECLTYEHSYENYFFLLFPRRILGLLLFQGKFFVFLGYIKEVF